ncbi:MFS transporter [Nordella sp. HKS 07]|uniref:MFS transporter n=1 Tax=Nordella sp. HKS 07 TaxID=2712222 RepID=UPI0013E181DF|nr:MFS transporter [Nordella sp. HKS 07]QIG47705.1 MFS transporter [Nordella sp. HKS 07]
MAAPSTTRLRRQLPLYGLFASGTVALIGNAIASVALPWFVLSLTKSPLWTGVAAAAGLVPLVIGAFFGGSLIDRYGARSIAIIASLVSAAAVAAVPLLHAYELLGIGLLIALIAIGAIFDGPGMTAEESRLPELARLARFRLEKVTSIDSLIEGSAALIGPAIAGLAIAAIGMSNTLWITALCSLFAAGIVALSLPRERPHRIARRAEEDGDVFAGLKLLFADPLLRPLLLFATAFVAVAAALGAVVMPAFFLLGGRTALDLGLFLSILGGFTILGTFAFALWGERVSQRLLFLSGCAAQALAFLVLAFHTSPMMLWGAAALAGFAGGPIGPIANAALLRRIPLALRGRALGAATSLVLVATPAAVLIAGAAVELTDARVVLWASAILLGAFVFAASLLPGFHELDRPAKAAGAASQI